MKKEIICISCPIGCRLIVILEDDAHVTVSGNKCPRGEVYGKEEILCPRRIVTAVVKTDSTSHPYVPVKTDKPLPREQIIPLLKELYGREAAIPIKRGDQLVIDFKGTGINVIITRTIKK
jgi:CxxC motif-containing protein